MAISDLLVLVPRISKEFKLCGIHFFCGMRLTLKTIHCGLNDNIIESLCRLSVLCSFCFSFHWSRVITSPHHCTAEFLGKM